MIRATTTGDENHRGAGFRFQVSGFGFQVSGFGSQVSGFRSQARQDLTPDNSRNGWKQPLCVVFSFETKPMSARLNARHPYERNV